MRCPQYEAVKFECSCGKRVELIPFLDGYFYGDVRCAECGRQMFCNWTPRPKEKTLEEKFIRVIVDKELMPTVAYDSGQAEWTVGEAKKLAQALVREAEAHFNHTKGE